MKKLLATLTLLSLATGMYAALSHEVEQLLQDTKKKSQELREQMKKHKDAYYNAPAEEKCEKRNTLIELKNRIREIEHYNSDTEDMYHPGLCGRCCK